MKRIDLTSGELASRNLTLAVNQIGRESDTGKFKVGDGATPWNSLAYGEKEPVADDVSFDNVASELEATSLQEAVDELDERIDELEAASGGTLSSVAVTSIGLPVVFESLYKNGLLTPPLNVATETPFTSTTSASTELNLSSFSADFAVHDIETRISTDELAWSAGPSGTDSGDGGTITLFFDALSPETLYYFQWRSVAPDNAANFSAWSASLTETTQP